MSIHYLDEPWPEPAEEPTRFQYAIGTRWVAVKELTESFTINVRTA